MSSSSAKGKNIILYKTIGKKKEEQDGFETLVDRVKSMFDLRVWKDKNRGSLNGSIVNKKTGRNPIIQLGDIVDSETWLKMPFGCSVFQHQGPLLRDDSQKFSLPFNLPTQMQSDCLNAIDEWVKLHCVQNKNNYPIISKWSDSKIRDNYVPLLKESDLYMDKLNGKINSINVEFLEMDMEKKSAKVVTEDIVDFAADLKGRFAVPLVELNGVWWKGAQWGIRPSVRRILLLPKTVDNEDLSFIFDEENTCEGGQENKSGSANTDKNTKTLQIVYNKQQKIEDDGSSLNTVNLNVATPTTEGESGGDGGSGHRPTKKQKTSNDNLLDDLTDTNKPLSSTVVDNRSVFESV